MWISNILPPVTLNFDLDCVKMSQYATHLGQKVI